MVTPKKIILARKPGEGVDDLARRVFGLPMGMDPESAAVLRYFFQHEFKWPDGAVPDDVEEIELPTVPELFRLYRDRALGERPTGMWTIRKRRHRPAPGKPRL